MKSRNQLTPLTAQCATPTKQKPAHAGFSLRSHSRPCTGAGRERMPYLAGFAPACRPRREPPEPKAPRRRAWPGRKPRREPTKRQEPTKRPEPRMRRDGRAAGNRCAARHLGHGTVGREVLHHAAVQDRGGALVADIGQAGGGGKEHDGGPLGHARQEVGRAGGAEQAAGRAAAKRGPHVGAFALLQQDQDDDGQRRDHLTASRTLRIRGITDSGTETFRWRRCAGIHRPRATRRRPGRRRCRPWRTGWRHWPP